MRKIMVFVLSGLVLTCITEGYIFGQMSGMIDAFMKSESHLKLTDNELSWIASTINISSIIGSIATAYITDAIGRKRSSILLTSPILINWIMLYFAHDFTVLIITRVIVGACFGAAFVLTSIATAEYTSPNTRGIFISVIMSVGPAVGTGIGHVLSTVMNWRYVALIGIIPTSLAVLLPFFWVESPSWLASKGRFEESAKTFRLLHGTSSVSEKELALLLKLEKSKLSGTDLKVKRTRFLDAIRQKRFWNVIGLSIIMSFYLAASGRSYLPVFAITIIKDITDSSDIVLYTSLLEAFIILGTILSCLLMRRYSMKPLLLIVGIVSNVFLLALSGSLYFKPGDISYMSWINVSLLSSYLVLMNSGPYPVILALIGEIYPLDLKTYCVLITCSTGSVILFVSVKMATWMFSVMGYHGMFLFYAIVMFVCLFMFWWKMPETKGRTLQEIELYFQNNTFENIDDLLSEQNKPLNEAKYLYS